jgi:hypothetical protein
MEKTNKDTHTVGAYHNNMSSSCRPPVNTTYLVIGQDLFSIDEYVKSQYNYSIHRRIDNEENNSTTMPQSTIANFVPAAFMVYTDLATLNGLWEPTDYGSGIEYADGILDLFPLHEYGDKSSIGLQVSLLQHNTTVDTLMYDSTHISLFFQHYRLVSG